MPHKNQASITLPRGLVKRVKIVIHDKKGTVEGRLSVAGYIAGAVMECLLVDEAPGGSEK